MSDSDQSPTMDPNALYREDIFTDRRIGTIKRMTPVTADGEVDSERDVLFSGETQILLGEQPLPIHFDLEVSTLGEAAEQFAEEAQKAAQDTIERLKEMQRDRASSIMVPGQEGMGGGGAPGGGKIQIP